MGEYYKGGHSLFTQLFDNLEQSVNNFQSIQTRVAAADGDKEKAYDAFMESSDDPQAIKLRTAIANATARLRELAEKSVVLESLSDEEKTKLTTEMSSHREQAKKGIEAVKSVSSAMAGSLTEDEINQVNDAVKVMSDKIGSGRGRKPGSTGSSLPRASVTLTVTGGNLADEKFETFTALSQKLSVEPKDLQLAYAAAAGVKHEDIKEIKHPVSFTFKPDFENASEYIIIAAPKEGKPRGRKPVETASK